MDVAGVGMDHGCGWGRDGPWMWLGVGRDGPWMWLGAGMDPGCGWR